MSSVIVVSTDRKNAILVQYKQIKLGKIQMKVYAPGPVWEFTDVFFITIIGFCIKFVCSCSLYILNNFGSNSSASRQSDCQVYQPGVLYGSTYSVVVVETSCLSQDFCLNLPIRSVGPLQGS